MYLKGLVKIILYTKVFPISNTVKYGSHEHAFVCKEIDPQSPHYFLILYVNHASSLVPYNLYVPHVLYLRVTLL